MSQDRRTRKQENARWAHGQPAGTLQRISRSEAYGSDVREAARHELQQRRLAR